MALSFPAVVLYGIALFSIESWITAQKSRRVYHYLTVFGLTPWLALHLFYVMILYLFAWMNGNGYAQAALPAAEALFDHLSWVVIASEGLMLPPFLYWAWLLAKGRSVLPSWMAAVNPLTIYAVLSVGKIILPEGAFRMENVGEEVPNIAILAVCAENEKKPLTKQLVQKGEVLRITRRCLQDCLRLD